MHFMVGKLGRVIGAMGTCFGTLAASSMAVAEQPPAANADMADEASHVGHQQQVQAGPRLGGHIGTATPLLTVSKSTTTIADSFTLLHPIGISLKFEKVTVDFETVVVNPIEPSGRTGLVIDPGVIYNFGPVAAGLRLAWQQADSNFGLIPLVNKGLVDMGGATWFVEGAFPTFYAGGTVQFNTVLHTGVGF